MKKITFVTAIILFTAACRPALNSRNNATSGNVDLTNYLAIGDDFSAGSTDGSLTVSGQLSSLPALLFGQFSQVAVHGAVGPFIQPLLTSGNGFPGPKFVLSMVHSPCNAADSSLSPVSFSGALNNAGDASYTATVNNGQINNIAVPGIRAVDFRVSGYANNNVYAKRFYRNIGGTPNDELLSMIGNLHPTFFTLSLGFNDVYSYALGGGQGIGNGSAVPLILPSYYSPSDISPVKAFEAGYDLALNSAISTGASGALINIPDITNIPFFNTIPANGLNIATQADAEALNAWYAATGIHTAFAAGSNYFMIQDNAGLTRQAVPGEMILMSCPASMISCNNWGGKVPIPNNYVLTTDEIQNVKNATSTFNAYIAQEAQTHHLALVDMNAWFKTIASGITYSGLNYNTLFIANGFFSLDGIHPTQRGYALLANQVIASINAFYKSTITTTDPGKYDGVSFP